MKAYIILNKENQERVDNVNSLIAEHNLNEYDLKIFDAIMAKNFPIKQPHPKHPPDCHQTIAC